GPDRHAPVRRYVVRVAAIRTVVRSGGHGSVGPGTGITGRFVPHQDYVYFSVPAPQEQKTLTDFRLAVNSFVASLKQNAAFAVAIAGHPWIAAPTQHREEILNTPEYLSSMAVFLQAVGKDIPPDGLHTLGLSRKNIPALNLEWLETLLTKCL